MTRRARLTAAALSVSLAGCGGGWLRVPPESLHSSNIRQEVQVWHDGHMDQLHAVRLTKDSLSGVPFFKDPWCDSCRIALARSEVDSVRFSVGGSSDADAGVAVGLGLGLLVLLLLLPIAYGPYT